MTFIPLNLDSKTYYQQMETNITVKGKTKRVRIELRYLDECEKWHLSMFDAQSGEAYFRFVPVTACNEDLNDLLSPFHYKNIGLVLCAAIVDEPSSENPKESNFNQFLVIWGDEIA